MPVPYVWLLCDYSHTTARRILCILLVYIHISLTTYLYSLNGTSKLNFQKHNKIFLCKYFTEYYLCSYISFSNISLNVNQNTDVTRNDNMQNIPNPTLRNVNTVTSNTKDNYWAVIVVSILC